MTFFRGDLFQKKKWKVFANIGKVGAGLYKMTEVES